MERPAVRLVAFDRRYLDLSATWLRDPEVKALAMAPDFTREQQIAFFEGLEGRSDYKIWGVEADGHPVGAAGIKHIEGERGESWCYIGERQWWGRGAGSQALALCEDRAVALGLRELRMVARADNQRSIAAYEKRGFSRHAQPGDRGLVEMSKAIGR